MATRNSGARKPASRRHSSRVVAGEPGNPYAATAAANGGAMEDPFLFAHAHDDVVWMSQNTNHLPTTPAIDAAIAEAVRRKEYNKYPYNKNLPGLNGAILADLGLPADSYRPLVTSGGTEALYVAMRAFLGSGESVVTTDPSYFIIHHFIRLSGAVPTDLPIYPAPGKLTIPALEKAVGKDTRMILLIDPLNPLGSGYSRSEVEAIAEFARERELILFHDVTYRDFADTHTLATQFAPERTLVAYSVSKNCGLAGMRCGALVAHNSLMDKAAPFNTNDLGINILAQFAAKAALESKKEWMPRVAKQTRRNQEIIKQAVDRIPGMRLPVYPSQANMFVIDIEGTGLHPDELQKELLFRHKVFVRSGNYVSKRFGQRFIRVSFSVLEEGVRRFAKALPAAVAVLEAQKRRGA